MALDVASGVVGNKLRKTMGVAHSSKTFSEVMEPALCNGEGKREETRTVRRLEDGEVRKGEDVHNEGMTGNILCTVYKYIALYPGFNLGTRLVSTLYTNVCENKQSTHGRLTLKNKGKFLLNR